MLGGTRCIRYAIKEAIKYNGSPELAFYYFVLENLLPPIHLFANFPFWHLLTISNLLPTEMTVMFSVLGMS